SHVRSPAIVLNSLVNVTTAGADAAPYRGLVAWLLKARTNGRWGNTQENALALGALVSYYRRLEATVPDFHVTTGASRPPSPTSPPPRRSAGPRSQPRASKGAPPRRAAPTCRWPGFSPRARRGPRRRWRSRRAGQAPPSS